MIIIEETRLSAVSWRENHLENIQRLLTNRLIDESHSERFKPSVGSE